MKLLPMFMAGVTIVVAVVHFVTVPPLRSVSLPLDEISYPEGKASSVVVLFSDKEGWTEKEDGIADELNRNGAVVVGVDLADYYDSLRDRDDECLYLVSDIEDLTHQLHRRLGIAEYHPPVVAGIGDGGTLALAIAAQTPESTISKTVAVDPKSVIPLTTELCTPADKTEVRDGIVYGLTEGDLPNPVTVIFSPAASADGRTHAQTLKETHMALAMGEASDAADVALTGDLTSTVRRIASSTSPLGLPIVPIDARPKYNTMAIIYSGDGGWRDIDQQLGAFMKDEGIPVVGVDALRYFWSEKTPEQTAADLSRIIASYRQRWRVDNVLLVGYSFGANILPSVYQLLPEADKKSISLISLLALSHQADFEIAVTGWFGFAGAGKHGDPVDYLEGIEPSKLQCIYGAEDDETACPAVGEIKGTQVLEREGGHHFDGDYEALNDLIVDRLKALLATN